LRRLFDYINNNVLFKVASLNTVSVLLNIIAGIFTSKAIAIFIGPEGMALIGNLKNFTKSVQSFATLGIYNGVVKYIAAFKNNAAQLAKLISTVYYVGFLATTLVCFFVYYNAEYLNSIVFLSYTNYTYIFKLLALALPFYCLNLFSFSIMNGYSKYRMLLIINIIGQILGLFITLILIWQNNLDGALISVVLSPSLIFLITFVGILNQKNFASLIDIDNLSFTLIKKISAYTMMVLISGLALPMVMILIRNYIGNSVGMQEAGFWEAMNRLSSYYLMFVSSLMALYILPRFSEIDNTKDFRKEVFSFYKTITPVFGIGLLIIYLLRPFVITIVFSKEFAPMEDLFLWQLMGDFIKVLSIVIAYQFIAKRMYWHFIITELFLVIMLYASSLYFIDNNGARGATIAHFVSYVFYFGIILMVFGTKLFGPLAIDLDEDVVDENTNEEH